MADSSSPKSSHSSSESRRHPPLKAMRSSCRLATLGSSSIAVESRAHNERREQEASSNEETFPYKCKCGRRFRTAQEYGGHQNAHTRPKKFMKECLERVRLNCLLLPAYRLPPDSPLFLQEEVARLRQKQSPFEPILSTKEKVRMHPYHSNRNPIVRKYATTTHALNPSLPFNSFNPKVLGVCQTFPEPDDNLFPTDSVPPGNAEVGAKNTTAYLPGASFTHPVLAPRSTNLNLAARNFVSFWDPDHGSENSMAHRGASALMRESAVPPPVRGGHNGGGVSARPGQSPSGVVHVEDDNPSGLDLELHL